MQVPEMSGKVTVTLRLERGDGQFVVSQTTIPGDLAEPPMGIRMNLDGNWFLLGDEFEAAYARLVGLPE